MTGRTIAHYQILEKLGEGGMGVVYKARDTHLGRFVAIKVLPPEKVADPERKQRFVQEAKAASALNHPNIVTIHDITQQDGMDVIVMEFVPGKTLGQLIGRKGLSLKETLHYGIQAADALAKAHAAGIVHRDLKPSNIMVTEDGLVKILDFGLAKLAEAGLPGEDESTRTLKPTTEEGKIVGTAAYMSPEQAEGRRLDSRSDIFSFGSVLYEMVTGRPAFRGDSKISTLAAVIDREPEPLSGVVPHDLEKVVTRCLRKELDRRFQHMGDVRVALAELKEESDSGKLAPAPAPAAPVRRRWAWVLAPIALVVIAGAASVWLLNRPGRAADPVPVPLTSYPGWELWPTFSPEGDRIAFSWNGPKLDNYDIYVLQIGEDQPVQLTKDPAFESQPAWSPDGRSIAFLRNLSAERIGVFLMPAIGGRERKLAEIWFGGDNSSLSWHPGGRWLVVSDKNSAGEPLALFLLSVETGEKRKLTSPPQDVYGDATPAVSPDGRALAFARWLSEGMGDLYWLELSGDLRPVGEPKRVTSRNSYTTNPAWCPDGRSVVFASGGASHDPSLWRISLPPLARRAGEPERLAFAGQGANCPAFSRQGRMAYARLMVDSDIWRLELTGSHRVDNLPLNSTSIDHVPQYSPDGKRIAFGSNRSGSHEIWVCEADGSNAVKLTSFGGNYVANPAWSPDGRRIAFSALPSGISEIYVVSADGGKPERLPNTQNQRGAYTWSRDGKWIYFFSSRTGKDQIWKVPAGGGAAVQVTRSGGTYAVESPDGKFLYYSRSWYAPENTELWRVPVEGGEETRIIGSVGTGFFAVGERGIYFLSGWVNPAVQLFHFATGKIETVARLEGQMAGGLSVSPDGRWLLYSKWQRRGSDLMLVENFR